MLIDTYTTFGCADGNPTFRYSLIDGVKEGYLVNPSVVDARTEITTQLLSDEGYSIIVANEDEEKESEPEMIFTHKDFERKLFSDKANYIFCKTFLESALHDPVTNETGKTIVFCVSQNQAAKLVQILNEVADKMFPDKYQSDLRCRLHQE